MLDWVAAWLPRCEDIETEKMTYHRAAASCEGHSIWLVLQPFKLSSEYNGFVDKNAITQREAL